MPDVQSTAYWASETERRPVLLPAVWPGGPPRAPYTAPTVGEAENERGRAVQASRRARAFRLVGEAANYAERELTLLHSLTFRSLASSLAFWVK